MGNVLFRDELDHRELLIEACGPGGSVEAAERAKKVATRILVDRDLDYEAVLAALLPYFLGPGPGGKTPLQLASESGLADVQSWLQAQIRECERVAGIVASREDATARAKRSLQMKRGARAFGVDRLGVGENQHLAALRGGASDGRGGQDRAAIAKERLAAFRNAKR